MNFSRFSFFFFENVKKNQLPFNTVFDRKTAKQNSEEYCCSSQEVRTTAEREPSNESILISV